VDPEFGLDVLKVGPHMLHGWEHYGENMRLELIDGVSHWFLNERPELVAERATAFFESQPQPSRMC
jgi:pimeloyl-ACP methyl ester carboxylesterase